MEPLVLLLFVLAIGAITLFYLILEGIAKLVDDWIDPARNRTPRERLLDDWIRMEYDKQLCGNAKHKIVEQMYNDFVIQEIFEARTMHKLGEAYGLRIGNSDAVENAYERQKISIEMVAEYDRQEGICDPKKIEREARNDKASLDAVLQARNFDELTIAAANTRKGSAARKAVPFMREKIVKGMYDCAGSDYEKLQEVFLLAPKRGETSLLAFETLHQLRAHQPLTQNLE